MPLIPSGCDDCAALVRRCFMGSEIEVLVVENCLLLKEDQDPSLKQDYKNAFELD